MIGDYTRRSFLDGLLGVATLGWIGSVLYPVLSYLKPPPPPVRSGPVRLSPSATERIEREAFTIVSAAGKRILVFRDGDRNLRALDARCTHEGCTVQYVPKESVVWCACHNARFDEQGRVISGPPPRPLGRYIVKKDGAGNVFVHQESA